jgi:hypothetical protein
VDDKLELVSLHLNSIYRCNCRLLSGPYESICDDPSLKRGIKTGKPNMIKFHFHHLLNIMFSLS